MLRLIDPQPVGLPGLVAMLLGFAVFFLALLAAGARGGNKDAEPDRQRRAPISIVGIVVQIVAFIAVGLGRARVGLASDSAVAIADAVVVAALMAFAAGMFLAASRAMGRNWGLVARTRSDHELVTGGPFARVRHPIYLALFAQMLALALAVGHWHGLILGIPLYWLGTWLRVSQEEKLLRARFGDAYETYARRVKRFLPGIL